MTRLCVVSEFQNIKKLNKREKTIFNKFNGVLSGKKKTKRLNGMQKQTKTICEPNKNLPLRFSDFKII